MLQHWLALILSFALWLHWPGAVHAVGSQDVEEHKSFTLQLFTREYKKGNMAFAQRNKDLTFFHWALQVSPRDGDSQYVDVFDASNNFEISQGSGPKIDNKLDANKVPKFGFQYKWDADPTKSDKLLARVFIGNGLKKTSTNYIKGVLENVGMPCEGDSCADWAKLAVEELQGKEVLDKIDADDLFGKVLEYGFKRHKFVGDEGAKGGIDALRKSARATARINVSKENNEKKVIISDPEGEDTINAHKEKDTTEAEPAKKEESSTNSKEPIKGDGKLQTGKLNNNPGENVVPISESPAEIVRPKIKLAKGLSYLQAAQFLTTVVDSTAARVNSSTVKDIKTDVMHGNLKVALNKSGEILNGIAEDTVPGYKDIEKDTDEFKERIASIKSNNSAEFIGQFLAATYEFKTKVEVTIFENYVPLVPEIIDNYKKEKAEYDSFNGSETKLEKAGRIVKIVGKGVGNTVNDVLRDWVPGYREAEDNVQKQAHKILQEAKNVSNHKEGSLEFFENVLNSPFTVFKGTVDSFAQNYIPGEKQMENELGKQSGKQPGEKQTENELGKQSGKQPGNIGPVFKVLFCQNDGGGQPCVHIKAPQNQCVVMPDKWDNTVSYIRLEKEEDITCEFYMKGDCVGNSFKASSPRSIDLVRLEQADSHLHDFNDKIAAFKCERRAPPAAAA
ncbi:hypothetical protein QQS21_005386 [Conoideocrella luteorostrata]|uniref:Uncharacterized protein n=1 Tax=Conoideocrella luteorostrata TaxID=1105319 RepID=A0AAJ0CRZ4_9HYPO|nr:hypothetical protein QQS21_005386 [Conoideocrella luteorostrata]